MMTISVAARTLVVVTAVMLASQGFGLVEILWTTLAVGFLSLTGQACLAYSVLQIAGNWLSVDVRSGLREVASFGTFTWLKSVVGVLFGYTDRLLIAALLGTGPLAFYTLCNQATQPIHALLAAGFNFIFPNLSARSASGRWMETEKRYRRAALLGVCIVTAICQPMILMSRVILTLWLGPAAAQQYGRLLVAMTIGHGLLAACIVPHYTALALGRSRALALMNLVTGVIALSSAYLLIRHFGLIGGGIAKVLAGLTSLAVFGIVRSAFRHARGKVEKTDPEFIATASLDLAR
jgi:O-antigen/teichoic acid export membrane protein